MQSQQVGDADRIFVDGPVPQCGDLPAGRSACRLRLRRPGACASVHGGRDRTA